LKKNVVIAATIVSSLALSLGLSANADAFVLKHAPSGDVVGWRSAHVEWTIDPSIDAIPGAANALSSAAAAWSAERGAPDVTISTTTEHLSPGTDGRNAILFAKEGFEPAGRALAVTILSYEDATGAVIDADIVLNGRYKLARIANGPDGDAEHGGPGSKHGRGHDDDDDDAVDEHHAKTDRTYDVARIATHELGHALGLGDEPARADAVMYPFVAPDRALRASPAADDLDGLATIYGQIDADEAAAAAARSQASCAVSGVWGGWGSSGSSSSRGGAAAFVLVGAAALVAARRRRSLGLSPRASRAIAFAGLSIVALAAPSAHADTTAATATEDATATATATAPGASPSAASRARLMARVERVTTVSDRGLFRSEIVLAPDAPGSAPVRLSMWGGTLGGVRQEVGGERVPSEGQRVELSVSAGHVALASHPRAL
jgi:hypothetical protein